MTSDNPAYQQPAADRTGVKTPLDLARQMLTLRDDEIPADVTNALDLLAARVVELEQQLTEALTGVITFRPLCGPVEDRIEVAQLRAELAAKNQELADEIEDHAATVQRLTQERDSARGVNSAFVNAVHGVEGRLDLIEAALRQLSGQPAGTDRRSPECVQRWPDARSGGHDPRCCRFPKACSAEPMSHNGPISDTTAAGIAHNDNAPDAPAAAIDLMAALKASVARAKAARDGEATA